MHCNTLSRRSKRIHVRSYGHTVRHLLAVQQAKSNASSCTRISLPYLHICIARHLGIVADRLVSALGETASATCSLRGGACWANVSAVHPYVPRTCSKQQLQRCKQSSTTYTHSETEMNCKYIEKIKIHSSCEIEDFVETHLCKLCVILRSRVLRVVCPH